MNAVSGTLNNRRQPRKHAGRVPAERIGESGLALLAVLGILTVLAIIATAFAVELRFEERVSVNYAREGSVRGATEVGKQEAISDLMRDEQGLDGEPFTGDESSIFDSDYDTWRYGSHRDLINGMVVELRRYSVTNSQPYLQNPPAGFGYIITDMDPLRRLRLRVGTDEDPPGDLSVILGIDGNVAPGYFGVDDDLDGLTDEDAEGRQPGDAGYGSGTSGLDNDDDEDGLIDEDAADQFTDGLGLALGTNGFYELFMDRDGDKAGIYDESAKIDINLAGNMSGPGFEYSSNSGFSPSEIDLGMLFYAVLRPAGYTEGQARQLARDVVAYRYVEYPGVSGNDDNGNNDALANVGGNQFDDDFNGIVDDVNERFIGPALLQSVPVGLTSQINEYIPGDKIDNDGDGLTDEDFNFDPLGRPEGTDDAAEFRPSSPTGDDNPFNTLEELRLVTGMDQIVTINDVLDNNGDGQVDEAGEDDFTVYQILEPFLTVYSSSPDRSPHLGSELYRLRINTLNNYTAPFFPGNRHRRRSPDELQGIGADGDHDWRSIPYFSSDPSRPLLSCDINDNGTPDGDWDWEADDPQDSLNGRDTDHDGWATSNGDPNTADLGDHDEDGNISSDPEPLVDEDPEGNPYINYNEGSRNATNAWSPGIGKNGNISEEPEANDDGDLEADEEDQQVKAAIDEMDFANRNSIPFDLVDNDHDGMTDEPGETYIYAFDEDEDGRWDEDLLEYGFLIRSFDALDQPAPEEVNGNNYFLDAVTRRSVAQATHKYRSKPYDPNELNRGTTGYDPLNPDPANEFYIIPDEQTRIQFEGVEGIRINEAMLEPYIRLNAVDSDFVLTGDVGDNAVCGGVQDTTWTYDASGRFFEVFDIGSATCNANPRVNNPEGALFTFRNLPAGTGYTLILHAAAPGVNLNSTFVNFAISGNPTAAPVPGQTDTTKATFENIVVPVSGIITVTFGLDGGAVSGEIYASFEYLDVIAEGAQYVELMNVSSDPIDMNKWRLEFDNTRAVIDNPLTIQPGGYAVLARNPAQFRSIYDPNGVLANVDVLSATITTAATDFDVVAFRDPGYPTAPPRDVQLTLYDADGGYMDSAEIDIKYESWQSGFEAFERADPTAAIYEYTGNPGARELVATHPWGDLYFKDAVIPETSRAAYQNLTEGWFWDSAMNPDEDNFLCYESPGGAGAIAVEWQWPNVRIKQGTRYRVRAYGREGDPIGSVNEVGGVTIGNSTSTASGRYAVDNSADNIVITQPADDEFSVRISGDDDGLAGAGLSAPYLLKSLNLVTDVNLNGTLYLTGSPGEDNAAFYPLRTIVEEPMVKNGLFATPGELLMVTSGEEFKRGDATAVAQLIDYVSTEPENGVARAGLVNINTAPKVVLMALPWSEPGYDFQSRLRVAELCAWAVHLWAHNPMGPDGAPGVANVDDDRDGNTDLDSTFIDSGELNFYGSDDGPFDDVGELYMCLNRTRTLAGQPLMQALQMIQPELTAERILARLSSLSTVRSSVFTVISQGKIVDTSQQANADEQTRVQALSRVLTVVTREQL